jgi:hypothetical protein
MMEGRKTENVAGNGGGTVMIDEDLSVNVRIVWLLGR